MMCELSTGSFWVIRYVVLMMPASARIWPRRMPSAETGFTEARLGLVSAWPAK